MYSLEELEEYIIKMEKRELVNYLFENNLICREMLCTGTCKKPMKFETAQRYTDGYAWRCYNKDCTYYRKRKSIRDGSFFEDFRFEAKTILKVIFRYCGGQQQSSIIATIAISRPTYDKILSKLIGLMAIDNRKEPKLGGPLCIVQVDETMLNYKCKSNRGRSSTNRTDGICIVEVRSSAITRVWAEIIPNKSISTMLPIICEHVLSGSTIHTDEHRSYGVLGRNGFEHATVCHKYMFVDREANVHTQHVESFNNCLKYEIKKRKGVKTINRAAFLSEQVWKWNNKTNMLDNIFKLIKT